MAKKTKKKPGIRAKFEAAYTKMKDGDSKKCRACGCSGGDCGCGK